MLHSIDATYMFHNKLEKLMSCALQVMGTPRHDRSDHNHLYRRIAKSVREGKDDTLNYEAFDDVLLDQNSGLTHAALIGIRKQSLIDAERLLSYHVVESLRKNSHQREAKHVEMGED